MMSSTFLFWIQFGGSFLRNELTIKTKKFVKLSNIWISKKWIIFFSCLNTNDVTLFLHQRFAEDAGTSSALMAFSSSILMNIFEATGLVNISIGFNRVMSIVDREISDHERTFEKGNIRDFIDCFIDEKLSMKSDQETLRCGHQNLRNIALDLFLAGSETTATTLKWAVLFMILHQDVQAKVQVTSGVLNLAKYASIQN